MGKTDRAPVRQARAMDTRARLLAAARQAFAEQGHDGVNLKTDILEPAGVSIGSFYHQFTDKTDLLVTLLDEAVDEWRDEVIGADVMVRGEGLEGALRASFTRFFAGLERGEDLWRIHLRERTSPEPRIRDRVRRGRDAWRRDIAALFAADRPAPGYPERAADLLLAFSVGLAGEYLDRPKRQRTAAARRELVEEVTRFAVGGLGALRDRTPTHDDDHPVRPR